ncbi:MAG: hypothetical protein ACI9EF_002395 [Pseudohongiellaceae bacterium]|jgi:hypothetical protein
MRLAPLSRKYLRERGIGELRWRGGKDERGAGAHGPGPNGAALALHGDTVAVGAPDADENTKTGSGAVYVFVRNDGAWSQQARLISPQPQFNAAFGKDLDIEDDTLFVGEPHATPQGGLTSAGAGQMFERVGTSWSHDVTLFSLDIAPFDDTGLVALSGNRAVLGSPGLFGPGELTTFERQGGNWIADEWIFDLNWNGTGCSVDIDGTTVVTGTTAFLGTGQRPGALIYDEASVGGVRGSVAWARDGNSGNQSPFWTAIYELQGDTLLVSSPLHHGAAEDGGVVHVFTRDGPWSDLQNDLKGTSFLAPLLYAAGSLASPSENELLLAGLPGGGGCVPTGVGVQSLDAVQGWCACPRARRDPRADPLACQPGRDHEPALSYANRAARPCDCLHPVLVRRRGRSPGFRGEQHSVRKGALAHV